MAARESCRIAGFASWRLRISHPVFHSIMQMRLSLAAVVAAASLAAGEESLQDHRWKHRLVVVPAAAAEVLKPLEDQRGGLDERHIRVIVLDPEEMAEIHREIATRFRLKPDSKEILLIGKDGSTTVRWPHKEFTVEKLFQRIDAMPMRRREMERPSPAR